MTSPGTPPVDAIPSANWKELFLWFVGRRRRYRVRGASMRPLLEDEDEVLVDARTSPRVGDVVVARHPFRKSVFVVKTLASFDDEGRAHLVGLDPAASTDSRSLGAFAPDLLRGRVTSALRPRASG